MVTQAVTIARNTFVEAVRQPVFFIIIALGGILQIFNTMGTNFAMGYTESGEVSGDNKLLLDVGLATVFVCGMLLAAFSATAVLSREIEKRTVLTVVSKPVPRPVVVIGKYVGVSAVILLGTFTMLLFLQLALRHEVQSTTADDPDYPVIYFTFIAVLIAVGVGAWGNFFYGWNFTQTAGLLLLPCTLLAFLLVLLINEKWEWQPISTDWKPQIALASLSLILASLVLSAIAVAASARLGQVMTLVICAGVFVFGLLSNHLLGRYAYSNQIIARIESARPESEGDRFFPEPGSVYTVTLTQEPRVLLKPGDSFFYSASPSGFPMGTVNFPPFTGNVAERTELLNLRAPPSLVITQVSGRTLTVTRAGGPGPLLAEDVSVEEQYVDDGSPVLRTQPAGAPGATPGESDTRRAVRTEIVRTPRDPQAGDFVFIEPTRVNPLAFAAWGVVPNVQFFWLVDAVSQNQPIPLRHVILIGLYAAVHTGAFLGLAVILFQKREVG